MSNMPGMKTVIKTGVGCAGGSWRLARWLPARCKAGWQRGTDSAAASALCCLLNCAMLRPPRRCRREAAGDGGGGLADELCGGGRGGLGRHPRRRGRPLRRRRPHGGCILHQGSLRLRPAAPQLQPPAVEEPAQLGAAHPPDPSHVALARAPCCGALLWLRRRPACPCACRLPGRGIATSTGCLCGWLGNVEFFTTALCFTLQTACSPAEHSALPRADSPKLQLNASAGSGGTSSGDHGATPSPLEPSRLGPAD